MALLLLRLAPIWLFLLLTGRCFYLRAARRGFRTSFALAWAGATVATGAACIAITEGAGALSCLTPGFCLSMWLAVDACALAALFFVLGDRVGNWSAAWWVGAWRGAPGQARALTVGALLFLLILGLFAFATPTTVWDSQTFHMPRVMHWMQQRSVAAYATNIPRQIEYAPGAEMAIMQLMLLGGSDRVADLPQWWSLVTCAVLAAFIAKALAAGALPGRVDARRASVCAALALFLTATFPEADDQAVSSLCDLSATAWVMSAIVFAWVSFREPGNVVNYIISGAAAALAISSKPTTPLYGAPFGLLIALAMIRRRKPIPLVKIIAAILIFVALLDGPWMMRNRRLLGNPIGSRAAFSENTVSRIITPAKVAANVVRNISLYTRTPSRAVTGGLNTMLAAMMALLDEPLDDPSWTFQSQRFHFQEKAKITDGSALGNCYMPLLLAAATVAFAFWFKPASEAGLYLLAWCASFLLFCAVLKWDPWHDRLLLSYLLLAAPFIAAVIGSGFKRWAVYLIAAFLLVNAALAVTCNPTYPTLSALFRAPREELCFAVRPELAKPTAAVADDILRMGCTNVLLKVDDDTWEYPLWALLRARGFRGTINHALVENESAVLPQASWSAPSTVMLVMHVAHPAIPKSLALEVSYDVWRAFSPAAVAEQRVRMIGNRGVLKYTFAQPGMLNVSFEPCDAAGLPIPAGALDVTIENIETNLFQTVRVAHTNLPVTPKMSLTCKVVAPSVTILLTNQSTGASIAELRRVNAVEMAPQRGGSAAP